jgi:hypothetical protein
MFQEVPFRFMEEVKDEEFVYPNPGESESDFVSRCMGDTQMIGEFPDEEQRAAVCYSYYKEKMEVDNDDYEMVEGVIDLLLQVEDLENRKEIARQVINDFANEGGEYDLEQFLSRLGLSEMTFDLETFKASFIKVADFMLEKKVKISTDFIYLGIALITIYSSLEKSHAKMNVKKIYLNVKDQLNAK